MFRLVGAVVPWRTAVLGQEVSSVVMLNPQWFRSAGKDKRQQKKGKGDSDIPSPTKITAQSLYQSVPEEFRDEEASSSAPSAVQQAKAAASAKLPRSAAAESLSDDEAMATMAGPVEEDDGSPQVQLNEAEKDSLRYVESLGEISTDLEAPPLGAFNQATAKQMAESYARYAEARLDPSGTLRAQKQSRDPPGESINSIYGELVQEAINFSKYCYQPGQRRVVRSRQLFLNRIGRHAKRWRQYMTTMQIKFDQVRKQRDDPFHSLEADLHGDFDPRTSLIKASLDDFRDPKTNPNDYVSIVRGARRTFAEPGKPQVVDPTLAHENDFVIDHSDPASYYDSLVAPPRPDVLRELPNERPVFDAEPPTPIFSPPSRLPFDPAHSFGVSPETLEEAATTSHRFRPFTPPPPQIPEEVPLSPQIEADLVKHAQNFDIGLEGLDNEDFDEEGEEFDGMAEPVAGYYDPDEWQPPDWDEDDDFERNRDPNPFTPDLPEMLKMEAYYHKDTKLPWIRAEGGFDPVRYTLHQYMREDWKERRAKLALDIYAASLARQKKEYLPETKVYAMRRLLFNKPFQPTGARISGPTTAAGPDGDVTQEEINQYFQDDYWRSHFGPSVDQYSDDEGYLSADDDKYWLEPSPTKSASISSLEEKRAHIDIPLPADGYVKDNGNVVDLRTLLQWQHMAGQGRFLPEFMPNWELLSSINNGTSTAHHIDSKRLGLPSLYLPNQGLSSAADSAAESAAESQRLAASLTDSFPEPSSGNKLTPPEFFPTDGAFEDPTYQEVTTEGRLALPPLRSTDRTRMSEEELGAELWGYEEWRKKKRRSFL